MFDSTAHSPLETAKQLYVGFTPSLIREAASCSPNQTHIGIPPSVTSTTRFFTYIYMNQSSNRNRIYSFRLRMDHGFGIFLTV